AVVPTSGTIPGEAVLGINRSVRLRRYEVEAAHMGGDYEDAVIIESSRPQAIRVDVHVDFAAALTAFRERARPHDLTVGTNGNVTVSAIVRAGHKLWSA